MAPERKTPLSRDDWARVDAAFSQALDQDEELRETWVRNTWADDPALRDAVLDLLADEARGARFFEAALKARDAVAAEAVADEPGSVDLVGSRIGAWRLASLIATGGMGAVYRAERDDGEYRQTAALKILPGWATDSQSIARLRAERQILSSLQHPQIPRLLDGGRTGDGFPYLVTEFIDGVPVTDFVARNDLSLHERLVLFLDICDAVDYAHRQGIVHRDIKPSNILVDRDGRPHLLDFGIAKLHEAGASPVTMPRTATGFAPMTPEYASPEQRTGGEVGVASDVYQLGLLLFRLLTGERMALPVDAGARPVGGVTRPSTAVLRQSPDRRRLGGLPPSGVARVLRGDLDTIALKALRDDPIDRYRTARALSRDLRHYLAGEAIEARPESAWSLTRRLARRHPVAASLAGALVVVLVIWAVSLSFYARELERQRDEAARQAVRAGEVRDVLVDIFRRSDPLQADAVGGKAASVWASLGAAEEAARERLDEDPEVLAELLDTLSTLQGYAGNRARSLALMEESAALYRALGPGFEGALAENLSERAKWTSSRDLAAAEVLQREAEALLPGLRAHQPVAAAGVLLDLAIIAYDRGDWEQSLAHHDEALALLDGLQDAPWSLRIEATFGSGNALVSLGRLDEAEARLSKALASTRTHFGDGHYRVSGSLAALSHLERGRGNPQAAVHWGEELVAVMERHAGEDSEGLLAARNNLAIAYDAAGRQAEAQAMQRQVVATSRRLAGPEGNRALAVHLKNLASSLHGSGDLEEARRVVLESRDLMETYLPPGSPVQATPWFTLGLVELDSGRVDAAEVAFRTTLSLLEPAVGQEHVQVHVTRCFLAEARRRQGHGGEALTLAQPALAGIQGAQRRYPGYEERCRETMARLQAPVDLTGSGAEREDASSP